jgi:hypothetical protein
VLRLSVGVMGVQTVLYVAVCPNRCCVSSFVEKVSGANVWCLNPVSVYKAPKPPHISNIDIYIEIDNTNTE